jgi:hypothetical protein
MSSQFTDFLNTFINLKQIQLQTEQVAQTAKTQAVSGVDTFMRLAQHTANPMELTSLVDRFSQLGVASREQLSGILQHVVPTAEAQKEYDVWRGRQMQDSGATDPTVSAATRTRTTEAANVNATGMNSGQLSNSKFISDVLSTAPTGGDLPGAMATRLAAGMSPGEMAVDQAVTQLPANELQQAGGAKVGTRMTAAQDANNQSTWATIRMQDRNNTAESAYHMGSLEVEAAKARAAAAGHDPQTIDHLITAKTSLMATLKDAKNKNPSAQELMSFIGGLNAINAQMSAYGIPNEGQIDYKPEMLTQPGFLTSLNNFLNRNVKNTSTPVGSQPAGTGRK